MPDWLAGNLLLLPTSVWFIFLMIIPIVIIVAYSVGHRSIYKPVRFSWGSLVWSNYSKALNPEFLPIFIRSIAYAAAAPAPTISLTRSWAFILTFCRISSRTTSRSPT